MATRVPLTIAAFFTYLETTDGYLQEVIIPPTGERLGMDPAKVVIWHTFAVDGAALYITYKDPLLTGPNIKKKVRKIMKDFRAFAQPQLNIIAASDNATTDDATVFNVVLVRKTPTRVHPVITAICYALASLLGGAKLKFKCRTISDGKTSKLAEGADTVEVAYIIGDKDTKAPSADEIDTRKTFSKATFVLSLGTVNSGKILYIYFRWTNSKHPETASPWSDLQIIQIV